MLALRTELILSLFLTVSSQNRFFPRVAHDSRDDNEEMVSSADSSLESSELDYGRVSNLARTPPEPLAAGLPFRVSPRLTPGRLDAASHQWSTFLGLQRGRNTPAKGAGHLFGRFGFQSSVRSPAPTGVFPTRRRTTDRARVPVPAFMESLQANRKNGGGLQIRKEIAYGVWGSAPASIQRELFLTKQNTQDLQGKKKVVHETWESSRQPTEDLPTRQVPDDGDWGSGAGPSEDLQTKPKAKARAWDPAAPSTIHDAQTRQRTAEEAWRRMIEKGSGVTEEIVLPLTGREASRSNCRTVPFAQIISHPNCKTFTVQNQLCFGQCSSFFIPGAEQKLYRSCSRCFPSRLRKIVVLLECEDDLAVSKDVTLVEECNCDLEKEPPMEN